jgi:cytochrome P450
VEGERFDGPIATITRITARDVEVAGVLIPEGAGISLMAGSANRDPDAFPDPDVFDIHREGPMPLVFGLGRHVCPGMNIARSEMATTMLEMFDQLPGLRLDPDAPPPVIRGVHARGPATLRVVWD